MIATELSGLIVEVPVQENQRVSRGQLLFRLDDQPYRTALAKIESEAEIQRAEIRGLRAQWRTKREDIKAALSQQVYAQADYERQRDLAERKFAPAAKLEESRMSADVARQRIASAEEDLQRIEAQLAGDPKIKVDDHPKVKQMLATRDEALLNLRRATIESPLDGIVAKRPVPGSYATAGQPAIVVVAAEDLWVEANFKETELTRVRPGQPATIRVDTYPDMECHGTVLSIAQATGAEFAVLPPQNASGNWVKVVQRLPVRLRLIPRPGEPPRCLAGVRNIRASMGWWARPGHGAGRTRAATGTRLGSRRPRGRHAWPPGNAIPGGSSVIARTLRSLSLNQATAPPSGPRATPSWVVGPWSPMS